jgi:hypothetical protein
LTKVRKPKDPTTEAELAGLPHGLGENFHSLLNQNRDAAFPGFKRTWSFAVTPLDQLRLRLTDHDFDRLMQAAKPVPAPDRDAFLKDVAAELGQHEVVGPGLLHRVISEVQRRYIAPREREWGIGRVQKP